MGRRPGLTRERVRRARLARLEREGDCQPTAQFTTWPDPTSARAKPGAPILDDAEKLVISSGGTPRRSYAHTPSVGRHGNTRSSTFRYRSYRRAATTYRSHWACHPGTRPRSD